MAVVQLVNSFTRIALFLAGAALVRACEHGHLSLRLVVQGWLGLASAGSMALCGAGVLLSLCAVASLHLCLATLVRSMPQCALLAFPVCIMHVLSRGNTPLDTMPQVLQTVMQGSPSTPCVSCAQAILAPQEGTCDRRHSLYLLYRQSIISIGNTSTVSEDYSKNFPL